MKRQSLLLLILFFVVLFWNCDRSRAVPFSELESYIEVSKDSENAIIFRSFTVPNSFQSITEATLTEKIINGQKNYYLVLLYGPFDDKNSNPKIKKMPWGGIKVTFQGIFDLSIDQFYYIDRNGKYKMHFGTQETWKKKIEEVIEKNNINEEFRAKFLSEI